MYNTIRRSRCGFFCHIEDAVLARIKLRDCFIYKSADVSFISAGDHIYVHDSPVYGALRCDRYRHNQGFSVGSDIHQCHDAVRAAQWGCIPVNVLRGNHHDRVLYRLQYVSSRSFPQPVVIRVFSESTFRLGFVLRFCNGIHMAASHHKRQVRHSQFPVDLRRVANQKRALCIDRSVQNAMHGVLILCRDLILCPLPGVNRRNRIPLRRASGLAGFFCALRLQSSLRGLLHDACLFLRQPVHACVGVRADLLDVRIQLRAVRKQLVDLCLFLFSRHHVVVVQQAAHHQGAEYQVRRAAGGEESGLRRLPKSP